MNILYNFFEIKKSESILTKTLSEWTFSKIPNWKFYFKTSTAFQEPLLFSYFNTKQKSHDLLKQLLFGYVKHKINNEKFKIITNECHVAFLPQFGYIHTTKNELLFEWRDKSFIVTDINGDIIKQKFTPIRYLAKTSIELIEHPDIFIEKSFVQASNNLKKYSGTKTNIVIENKIGKYQNEIEGALKIIKDTLPSQYSEINNLVKRLVLMKGKEIIAFTSIDMNGIVFLKPRRTDKRLFFVEHLIHEDSHIALNLILMDVHNFFTIDPFKKLFPSPFRKDLRGIYQVFHAVFVLARIVNFFDILYSTKKYDSEEKYEVMGRLLSSFYNFQKGFDSINDVKLYSDKGLQVFLKLKELKMHITKKYPKMIKNYKIANQNEFDLRLFLKINKIKN